MAIRILVFAELRRGKIPRVFHESMTAAHALAKEKAGQVAVLCIGKDASALTPELTGAEPAKIYLAEHSTLEYFLDEAYAAIFYRVIQEYKPDVVLAGATMIGRPLMARVAALCDGGLAADCVELAWDGDVLKMVRPVYGGTALAAIRVATKRLQMATIRPKVMREKAPNPGATCEIVKITPAPEEIKSRTQVLEQVQETSGNVNLWMADVIVSGGRGLKAPENFKLIRELAETLDGAVGASRAVVDAGWIPYAHQVGQTGKTVRPKLYIACGISGAIQHLIGMRTSDTIVVINKDPDAPIFGVATIGLVGDLFEIVPLLTKRLKEVLKK